MATFTQPGAAQGPDGLENNALGMMADPKTSTLGLLALLGYGADRQQANRNQEGYGQTVLALQQRQAQAENAQKGAGVAVDALKLITENPGHAAAISSNPYLSSFMGGTDMSGSVATGERLVNSKVIGEAGRGIGSMAMGGVQLDPGYISGVLGQGSGATYGASPIERAAAIRAAGGEGGDTVTIVEPTTGGGQATVKSKNPARATSIAAALPNTLAKALGSGSTKAPNGVTTRAANAQETATITSAPAEVQASIRAAGNKVVVTGNRRGFLMEGNNVWPIP